MCSPALLRGVAYRGNAGLLLVQEFKRGIGTREVFAWTVQHVVGNHAIFGFQLKFDPCPFGITVAQLLALLIDPQKLAGGAAADVERAAPAVVFSPSYRPETSPVTAERAAA